MAHLSRWLVWSTFLALMVLWIAPTGLIDAQAPTTAVDVTSGSQVFRLGDLSTSSIRMFIVGSNTTLQTTASVTVDSVTVVNVVSMTALSPLPTTATLSASSLTARQDVGSQPWIVIWSGTNNVLAYPTGVYATTVIGPLTTSVASGTSNVLAYPTGVYMTTQVAPYSMIFSGTQNVLAYPTGVTSVTQVAPFSMIFSGTQNVLAYPTGVTSVTSTGSFSIIPSGTQNIRTLASGIDTVTAVQSSTAINFERYAGIAVTSGTGVSVTPGTQKVAVSQDSQVKVWDGTSQWQLDPCQTVGKQNAAININGANTTRIVAPTAAKRTYLCSMFVFAATTINVGVVEGTGGTCAVNLTGVMGGTTGATGPNLVAQTGWTIGNGLGTIAVTAHTNYDFCLITSTTGQLSGNVMWVAQ